VTTAAKYEIFGLRNRSKPQQHKTIEVKMIKNAKTDFLSTGKFYELTIIRIKHLAFERHSSLAKYISLLFYH